MTQTTIAEIDAIPAALVDVSVLRELADAGALTISELNLGALDHELTPEMYARLGAAIGEIKRKFSSMTSWWVGDWMLFGEGAYEYEQVSEATGLTRGAIANYVWVCSRWPRARRRPSLSFGHHSTVAAMPPRSQNAWLKKAIDNDWSREQLRQAIKDADELPVVEQPEWSENGNAPRAKQIEDAARMLIREASDAGDGRVVVPKERVDRLAALLGEDEG